MSSICVNRVNEISVANNVAPLLYSASIALPAKAVPEGLNHFVLRTLVDPKSDDLFASTPAWSDSVLHRRSDPGMPRLCRVTLRQAQAKARLQAPQGCDALNRSGFCGPLGLPRYPGPSVRSGSCRFRLPATVIRSHFSYL